MPLVMQYYVLKKKYDKLSLKMKSHLIRVQFIKRNHLPITFKINEYLLHSELRILINMLDLGEYPRVCLLGFILIVYVMMALMDFYNSDFHKNIVLTVLFVGYCFFFS